MGQRIPEQAAPQEAAPAEGGGEDQFSELVNNVINGIGTVMKIMDVLLPRHRQVARIEQPRSMIGHSNNIVSNAENNILRWIEINALEEL